eukprot:10322062-Alexandrium_andersonii.AAC.1
MPPDCRWLCFAMSPLSAMVRPSWPAYAAKNDAARAFPSPSPVAQAHAPSFGALSLRCQEGSRAAEPTGAPGRQASEEAERG